MFNRNKKPWIICKEARTEITNSVNLLSEASPASLRVEQKEIEQVRRRGSLKSLASAGAELCKTRIRRELVFEGRRRRKTLARCTRQSRSACATTLRPCKKTARSSIRGTPLVGFTRRMRFSGRGANFVHSLAPLEW
ncbi:hypothetical protein Y032_0457g1802 [Ancylostoma ceylanicum]|uniref:Uncharacterized protein n=1 Tax=Ancylostoma ceylanicum TaxID=53326 RepID=A0A016WYC3_9BILA|nr:hypothetical protein Y032_0457g1802 [Ancylostoma ceylanicum]